MKLAQNMITHENVFSDLRLHILCDFMFYGVRGGNGDVIFVFGAMVSFKRCKSVAFHKNISF